MPEEDEGARAHLAAALQAAFDASESAPLGNDMIRLMIWLSCADESHAARDDGDGRPLLRRLLALLRSKA